MDRDKLIEGVCMMMCNARTTRHDIEDQDPDKYGAQYKEDVAYWRGMERATSNVLMMMAS